MRKTRIQDSVLSLLHAHILTLDVGYTTRCAMILHLSLDLGMPVDYKPYFGRWTHLENAVSYNDTPCVELLIRCGADVNHDRGRPVRIAVCNNRLEILRILLKVGANVDSGGIYNSAISQALTHARCSIVEELLFAGAVLPDDALSLAKYSHTDSALKVDCVTRITFK